MSIGNRVLVVEDDDSVRNMLLEYLSDQHYDVTGVADGRAMREQLERAVPDLILLDVRLPGEDGISLARFLRERFAVPIIMVTASDDLVDRVVGLEVGADDYVVKPFDPRELLARVRSVLRRAQPDATAAAPQEPLPAGAPSPAPRVQVGRCWLELESRRLFDGAGDEVPLTAMEYELLRVFVANPNRVLSRDQLLMHSRNREWEPFDRSVDICIGRVRRKIEADAADPQTIRTIRNGGYMFVPGAA